MVTVIVSTALVASIFGGSITTDAVSSLAGSMEPTKSLVQTQK